MKQFNTTPYKKEKYLFIYCLIALTLSTVILMPLFPKFFRPTPENLHISFLVLGWLSTAHVATTGFFYIDSNFSSHIKARPNRYVVAPILSIITCILLWGIIAKENHVYLWMIFISWLLWHYQKQNYGLAALVSNITNGDRLTILERKSIMLISVGSIIAVLRFKANELNLPFLTKDSLYMLGLCIYLGAALSCFYAIYLRLKRDNKRNLFSSMFIILSVIFFAPTFLSNGFFPAVTSYAIAHALQYWLMMSTLVITSRAQNGNIRSIGGFFVVVMMIYGAIWFTRNPNIPEDIINYMIGLQFGITVAHFIIDADAWKLSEKSQRNYIQERYDFLFSNKLER